MQAGSASLAHWFDEERCSLQSRLDTLEDPTYLDARGRVLHERTAAAVKVQSMMRGFLLRQRFFQQLEREAMQLSYEVSTEAQLRWVRVKRVVTDARPVRHMLQQLYSRMDEEVRKASAAEDSAAAVNGARDKYGGGRDGGGIAIASSPAERMESLSKSAVRLSPCRPPENALLRLATVCRRAVHVASLAPLSHPRLSSIRLDAQVSVASRLFPSHRISTQRIVPCVVLCRVSILQERALKAVESQSELGFALCRRDYRRLKRLFDAQAQGNLRAIEAREQEAGASKLQAMWRGRRVRSSQQTQREATSLLLEIQVSVADASSCCRCPLSKDRCFACCTHTCARAYTRRERSRCFAR